MAAHTQIQCVQNVEVKFQWVQPRDCEELMGIFFSHLCSTKASWFPLGFRPEIIERDLIVHVTIAKSTLGIPNSSAYQWRSPIRPNSVHLFFGWFCRIGLSLQWLVSACPTHCFKGPWMETCQLLVLWSSSSKFSWHLPLLFFLGMPLDKQSAKVGSQQWIPVSTLISCWSKAKNQFQSGVHHLHQKWKEWVPPSWYPCMSSARFCRLGTWVQPASKTFQLPLGPGCGPCSCHLLSAPTHVAEELAKSASSNQVVHCRLSFSQKFWPEKAVNYIADLFARFAVNFHFRLSFASLLTSLRVPGQGQMQTVEMVFSPWLQVCLKMVWLTCLLEFFGFPAICLSGGFTSHSTNYILQARHFSMDSLPS